MDIESSHRVMTETELARRHHLAVKTLQNRRSSGEPQPGHEKERDTAVPGWFKSGNTILYFVDSVLEWERVEAAYQRRMQIQNKWNRQINGGAN